MSLVGERLRHAWNAFTGRDPTAYSPPRFDLGFSSYYRPDRPQLRCGNKKSIVSSIYNRIAVDVSLTDIEHVRIDEEGRFIEVIYSALQDVLSLEANIDQTGRALIIDICLSMFDEGCVAVVPVDTTIDPKISGSYEINSLRTGSIVEWYPQHVKVRLYNDRTGRKEELILPKKMVAIIENPFYAIMNEPNSTLQRLIRTLNKLDLLNDQNASGKLDLIIQLPYVIKTEERRKQAESRRKEIEAQLTGSKYGIAYADGTEKIVQLNRSIENRLWEQVKELTSMLYNQLGLTQAIFDGTANEDQKNDYYTRTIDPILLAIVEEMTRKFITKNARTRGEAIRYFRDPFRSVSMSSMADVINSLRRNEIVTANEVRSELGFKPSLEEQADGLANPANGAMAMPGEYADEAAYPEEEAAYPEDEYAEDY